jgi:flagellar biogenesis protein FliO
MESLQQLLTVVFVLALLGGTVYWLRSKGMARFTTRSLGRKLNRRMESIERLPLTPQHSLHLVRVAGRVLLIAVSPGGCSILDGNGWEIPPEDQMATR